MPRRTGGPVLISLDLVETNKKRLWMDVTNDLLRLRTGTGELIAHLPLTQTQILVLADFPCSLVLVHKTEQEPPVVCTFYDARQCNQWIAYLHGLNARLFDV